MKTIIVGAGTIMVLALGSCSNYETLTAENTAKCADKCEKNCCVEQPFCCPK